MTYLAVEFVLSSVGSFSGGFLKNVTKVTISSRLIIVLGKDEFSFANVSVFLVGRGMGVGGGNPPRDEHFLIIRFQLWTSQSHLQLDLASFRIVLCVFFFLLENK